MTEAELLERYEPLARAIARSYFLPGGDRDDVEAEALLATLIAIRSYSPAGGSTLDGWVGYVVHRRLKTAVRLARRRKHEPLNASVRGVVAGEDGELVDVVDLIADPRADVVHLCDVRERVRHLRAAIAALSQLEREAIAFVANGGAYSRQVTGSKRLDNAVQRARRKLLGEAA